MRIFLCILYKLIKSKFELFTQARQNYCKIIVAISGLKDFAIRLNLPELCVLLMQIIQIFTLQDDFKITCKKSCSLWKILRQGLYGLLYIYFNFCNCVNILAINFFKYNLFCLKTPNNMYFYYLSIKLNHFGVYTPSGSLHQISPEKHLQ